jgi:hypothetical protein
MTKLFIIIGLLFISIDTRVQAQDQDKLLTEVNFDGINISGEEYWVFDDQRPGSPYTQNRIIWNYRSAPVTAKKCARIAYDKLTNWLKDHDSPVYKSMKAYKKAGGPSGIYLWVNDYSKAPKQSKTPRMSKLWIWKKSLYKFEATLMPNGQCHTPSEKQVLNFINAKLIAKGLEEIQGNFNGANFEDGGLIESTVINNSPRRSWWSKFLNYFSFQDESTTESSSQ